ncbi:MAG: hypothetical protein IKG89_04565, partial [Oscillospiraceae bacterium]|nr:hypothetical protein [Oscillospiraceae bacterium]
EQDHLNRAEFEEEGVASGSSFFLKFNPIIYVLFFSRNVSPIIDDSTFSALTGRAKPLNSFV